MVRVNNRSRVSKEYKKWKGKSGLSTSTPLHKKQNVASKPIDENKETSSSAQKSQNTERNSPSSIRISPRNKSAVCRNPGTSQGQTEREKKRLILKVFCF